MSMASGRTDFRKDIHGLRGISVLLVVLFHFGVPGFEGGYLGVDIFFVISGYLITHLCLRERQRSGRISLGNFYLRRLKRILPAALAVLFVFGLLAMLLLPSRSEVIGAEMIWGTVALSNFFYAGQAGYFALSSEEFLFLNYWSLAVEEQFYLLWPVILIVGLKLPPRVRMVSASLFCLALLVLSLLFWMVNESAAFYHLAGRWWELGAGCALALWQSSRKGGEAGSNQGLLSLVGLVLILAALTLDPLTLSPHPLLPMVLVTAGSVGLIAGGGGIVAKALAVSIIQLFGSLSYALYLVHWPMKTLLLLYLGRPILAWEFIVLFVAAVLVSALLHFALENPMRYRRWSSRPLALLSLCMVAAVGVAGMVGPKIASAFSVTSGLQIADYAAVRTPLQQSCLAAPHPYPGVDNCAFGSLDRLDVDLWLVGDSHAEHWQPGLQALADRHGLKAVLFARNATLPAFGITQYQDGDTKVGSEDWRDELFGALEGASPATVVLSSRWALYYGVNGYGTDESLEFHMVRDPNDPLTLARTQTVMEDAMTQTITTLQAWGHHVILMGQVPELGISQIDCVERALASEAPTRACGPDWDGQMAYQQPSKALLQRLSSATGATVIFPDTVMCDDAGCDPLQNGIYIYRDDDHINPRGATLLVDALAKPLLADIGHGD